MSVMYSVKKPCASCPFRRSDGAVRLRRERIRQIARDVTGNPGAGFHCHQTVEETGAPTGTEPLQCTGALIFCEKQGKSTQMMRIAERIGLYDAEAMMTLSDVDDIFDTLREWLKTAI